MSKFIPTNNKDRDNLFYMRWVQVTLGVTLINLYLFYIVDF